MKKIVLLSLFVLCLPLAVMAQSNNDDLYFVPSKEKKQETEKTPVKKVPKKRTVITNTYTALGTTVVVQNRKGNKHDMCDVDEYDRRYGAKDNEFAMEDDTLYVKEKAIFDPDGEWVNGFDGLQDDYEYAERIICFRNPRFAVGISSPLYWDIVYGADSRGWNVYTDGLYAHAFPTFINRSWQGWRYNPYGPGWGWGWGWSSLYYTWGSYYLGYWGGYWGGYRGGWYDGGYWGYHHRYHPGWGGGGYYWVSRNIYTSRRSYGSSCVSTSFRVNGSSIRRTDSYTRSDNNIAPSHGGDSRMNCGSRRVINVRDTERPDVTTRTDASPSKRSTYIRPSSIHSSSDYNNNVHPNRPASSGICSRSTNRSSSTYTRGSSATTPSCFYLNEGTRRSYGSSSSSRSYSSDSSICFDSSYSSGSRSSGSSSRSTSDGGSYSRSSGGRR